MTDEEKKAIEYWQYIRDTQIYDGYIGQVYSVVLLNLIEKQQKEIEELKDKNKKLRDKCKELIFEKQELTSALLDSTPNDKIKAKIEELDNQKRQWIEDRNNKHKDGELIYAIEVLQSLL